jgi:hypothetical protein
MIVGAGLITVGIAWFYATLDQSIAASICILIGVMYFAFNIDTLISAWIARRNGPTPKPDE